MRARQLLADNVRALLDRDYPAAKYKNKSARQKAASRAVGVAWSTIQRLLDPKVGKHLDVLADVAAGFTVAASDLLRADIGETPRLRTGDEPEELQRLRG